MTASELKKIYSALPQCKALSKLLESNSSKTISLQGMVGSAAPLLFASLREQEDSTKNFPQVMLFILSDADEAGYFYHDLTQLMGQNEACFFPSSYRRAVKYGQRDAANEILRTEVLAKLSTVHTPHSTPHPSTSTLHPSSSTPHPSTLFIVTYPEALAELVVSKKNLDERILKLTVGETKDIVEMEHQLRDFGFKEEDYVYEPGQFARRGSILDVYSFSCELPFRIDFFGDEIDTIRTFEVEDQLSKDKRESIEIVPELALTATEKVPFMSFLPDKATLVVKDFLFVRETIERIYNEGFSKQALNEQLEGATEMEQRQIMQDMRRESQLCTANQFSEQALRLRRIEFGTSPTGTPDATIRFNTLPQPLFHKNFDLLKQTFEDYQLQDYRICILADSKKQHQRLREILDPSSLPPGGAGGGSSSYLDVDFTLHEGFVDNDLKTCFFTDHQIFDRFHKYNLKSDSARAGKMALTMKELQELEVGDYLVHVDYGIGKFGGLVRIPIGNRPGTTAQQGSGDFQEVIRIIYQHNDKVDVSIHSLYKISKYRRSDTGEPPRLSILGSGAWERLKERTKKRIKDIARDLIKLYAKRRSEKGFRFSADSYLQQELEASFLYEDTPDQLKATAEVKADMESAQPMDRLVCGDVGFGKTEVAVRAAFKAACDSKQVAVLVPTTVLAFQHYQTFRDRLKGMPVRVDYLSRARTAKQTKELLSDLKEGKVDILIGTHKIISKQV
ncbi:MAG: DEAD/DEAH box helicase, partial [Prevotella sp.]|nr:DEAD/DEAH box helicase [Prevotella sp.]